MHFSQPEQNQQRNPKSSIQFKPRQILLLESKNIFMTKNNKKESSLSSSVKESQENTKLYRAVGHFLWKSRLFKTLAEFQSELKLDKVDNWEQYKEEELLKWLDTFNTADGHFEDDKDQDGISKKDGASDCISSLETVSKKKKKKSKSDKLDSNDAENESEAIIEVIPKNIPNDMLKSDVVPEPMVKSKSKKKKVVNGLEEPVTVTSEVLTSNNGTVNEPLLDKSSKKSKDKAKDKKKKKSKSGTEALVESADDEAINTQKKTKEVVNGSEEPLKVTSEVLTSKNGTVNELLHDKSSKKSKDKKKKKSKSGSETLVEYAVDEASNTQTKESKKRKRSDSEVNDAEPVIERSDEESKRRKTVGVEGSKVEKQLTEVNGAVGKDGFAGKESKEEDGKVSFNESQEKSAKQKSLKKQNGGSAEPKSANAFQRVKIDKVVFTDERLQDNSYWAKDGAEIGYGAKAQEVLGQVRGRDFRHEKTKKKRGSYRGGTIDFTSHSVKFNYSDEE